MLRVRADRDAEWVETLAADSIVYLTFDTRRVHLFDRESGAPYV
jgi:hypothetical protein